MDGGTIDNYPIRHASQQKLTPFQKRYHITDDMMRLGVRLTILIDIFFLWNADKVGWLMEKFSSFGHWLLKFATGGIDSYATDDEVSESVKQRFHQRSMQMEDFGLSRTEFNLSEEITDGLCELSAENINFYFDQHNEEKVSIETYTQDMPMEMQIRLFVYLSNPEVETKDIFWVTGKNHCTDVELEIFRNNEIKRLSQLLAIKNLKVDPVEYLRKLDEGDGVVNMRRLLERLLLSLKTPFVVSSQPLSSRASHLSSRASHLSSRALARDLGDPSLTLGMTEERSGGQKWDSRGQKRRSGGQK